VEAENINQVVAQYGPCKLFSPLILARLYIIAASPSATKVGAVVAGQTSVKAPERAAFERHLPEDVHIVSCHSLHGPTVPAKDQPLVRLLP
jgi:prephenate dehydrogenase